MNPRLLVPRILNQINEIRRGEKDVIEINRLDARRDYINVNDVGLAIKSIIEGSPHSFVYNVGSGVSTSNQELLELILNNSGLKDRPKVIELSSSKEPQVASRADITRIIDELGWRPLTTIKDTIREVMNERK